MLQLLWFLWIFKITFFIEVKSTIIGYLNLNDTLKSGNLVSITHYYSLNQIYVRINTSDLNEYYSQLTTEVNQFYINSKGKSTVHYYIVLVYMPIK